MIYLLCANKHDTLIPEEISFRVLCQGVLGVDLFKLLIMGSFICAYYGTCFDELVCVDFLYMVNTVLHFVK